MRLSADMACSFGGYLPLGVYGIGLAIGDDGWMAAGGGGGGGGATPMGGANDS
jgi:hypothetical protein